jgi:mono/diheme cytochrome c family protein
MDSNHDHPFVRFTAFWWAVGLFAMFAVLLGVVWFFVRESPESLEAARNAERRAIRLKAEAAQAAHFERKVLVEGKTAQVAPAEVFKLVGRGLVATKPVAVEKPEQRIAPLPDTGAPLPEIPVVDPATPVDPAVMEAGKVAFTTCMACHGPEGKGMAPVFPPLAGSEWVVGPVANPIRIVLRGLQGPISVAGTEWNGVMAPLGAALDDKQIAAALTYVRNSWGNKASMVTPEQVAALRATEAGKAPLSAADLQDPHAGAAPAAPAAAPAPAPDASAAPQP